MGITNRFILYDISSLRGRVPTFFIDSYLDDPQNIELLSFIAGLLRSCGDFDLGITVSEDIIDKACMGQKNLKETSIGVWNFYILSKIYIEQEKFNKAYRALDAAERYWSKDLTLVDNTGMCRIKNKEDIWLRRAFAYLVQGRKADFESIIDKVIISRYELYNKAYKATGETPMRDISLLDCFEYSSYMCRNIEDFEHALTFIKIALRYLGRIPIDNDYMQGKICEKNRDLINAYTYYLKFYLANRPQIFCDTMIYGTCESCIYFETADQIEGTCKKINTDTDCHRACNQYIAIEEMER